MTACGSFVGVKLFLAPQAYTGDRTRKEEETPFGRHGKRLGKGDLRPL